MKERYRDRSLVVQNLKHCEKMSDEREKLIRSVGEWKIECRHRNSRIYRIDIKI